MLPVRAGDTNERARFAMLHIPISELWESYRSTTLAADASECHA